MKLLLVLQLLSTLNYSQQLYDNDKDDEGYGICPFAISIITPTSAR